MAEKSFRPTLTYADECHHASAKSYTTILNYFKPSFTLGLTATPERADGEDLLKVFQNVAHKLDVKDAVERGVLVPVRCIRVRQISIFPTFELMASSTTHLTLRLILLFQKGTN